MAAGMALLPTCRCALRHKGKGEPREAGMIARDQTFSDMRVVLDGCSFYNCTFPPYAADDRSVLRGRPQPRWRPFSADADLGRVDLELLTSGRAWRRFSTGRSRASGRAPGTRPIRSVQNAMYQSHSAPTFTAQVASAAHRTMSTTISGAGPISAWWLQRCTTDPDLLAAGRTDRPNGSGYLSTSIGNYPPND
jgi:hypothetical protein